MMRRLSIALAGSVLLAGASGAGAQANDKVLVIYGNDKCPAGVICVTRSENERYRIPKTIRDTTPNVGEERWADRAKSIANVGATGTGSCSNVGQGGFTGCMRNEIQASKAARQADSDAAPRAPQ